MIRPIHRARAGQLRDAAILRRSAASGCARPRRVIIAEFGLICDELRFEVHALLIERHQARFLLRAIPARCGRAWCMLSAASSGRLSPFFSLNCASFSSSSAMCALTRSLSSVRNADASCASRVRSVQVLVQIERRQLVGHLAWPAPASGWCTTRRTRSSPARGMPLRGSMTSALIMLELMSSRMRAMSSSRVSRSCTSG